ncbi:hypothetical protein GCM10011348_04420 [Marinobacterium nitratireducens]|uniref:YARHG domain-containing protein n=1 Tax=Marinobacterium nitratireducens TaxID=518897 RepID=A0A917Z6S1_9GAMM|nr:hypothetical protein [Marinobacterium nitratireducens]GGO76667.1 hypothetical protein GCM10011348_04420 [Marinobacterium nitratireducens]
MNPVWAALLVCCLITTPKALAELPVQPPGAGIHPLCFVQLFAALRTEDPFQPVACDSLPGGQPVEILPGQDAADLTYSSEIFGETGRTRGFVAYTVAGHWPSSNNDNQWTLFEVTTNYGDVGLYSSIWLLMQPGDRQIVEPLLYLPGGDRCNDGGLLVSEVASDRLIFMSAATPFRLLNPTTDTDWHLISLGPGGEPRLEKGPFMGWQPGRDVSDAATACAGRLVKSYNFKTDRLDVLGVHIDRQAFLDARQGSRQACINEWLKRQPFERAGALEGRVLDVDLDTWSEMLSSLGSECSG